MSTPFVVGFGIKKERREDILNCCRHDSIGFKYTIQILVEFCVNWATIKEKKKIKKERIEWCNCDPATLSLGAGCRCRESLWGASF